MVTDEALIEQQLKGAPNSDGTRANKKSEAGTRGGYSVMAFLQGVDYIKDGNLLEELDNDFVKGNDS